MLLRIQMGKTLGAVDYVLLDHRKNLYLPDLQTMEKLGLVVKGTLVVADNGEREKARAPASGPPSTETNIETNIETGG